MSMYKWIGVDADGNKASGKVDARSPKEVKRILRTQGIRPRRVIAPSVFEIDINEWMVEKGLAAPFGNKELLNFTKQLATMVGAGVPLLQSLEIIHKSEKHPALKKAVQSIATDVSEGKTIAEAMKKQQGFSKLYCNLVKAGEAGGILDSILEKLMQHMDRQEKTKSAIKSAMMYPAIVIVVGIGVVILMMTIVVPMMMEMFAENNQELPAITLLVIDISNFIRDFFLEITGVCVAVVVGISASIKTPNGKMTFDRVMMKMPIFGGIIIKGNLASFSRTLATMMGAGVPLVDGLEICIETIDHSVVKKDLKLVRKRVTEGKTLVEPLLKIEYFPDMVSQMIRVGEQTGNVDQMLEKVADVFEDEVNQLVNAMTKMIEPVVIVFLGVVVGGILIAMYLPMFSAAG